MLNVNDLVMDRHKKQFLKISGGGADWMPLVVYSYHLSLIYYNLRLIWNKIPIRLYSIIRGKKNMH